MSALTPHAVLTSAPRRLFAASALCLCLAAATSGCAFDAGEQAGGTQTLEALVLSDAVGCLSPASFAPDELDNPVGCFVYGGETHQVSARAAIEDSVSLESMLLEDGTYAAPTAEMVLGYARNRILLMAVEERGVSLDEGELRQYMLQTLGTDDLAQVAAAYGMDEGQARAILYEAACIVKLRDREVGSIGAPPLPPEAPAAGADAGSPTEAYGAYVLDLLDGSWNVLAGEWADTSGPMYEALAPYGFNGATASYEMAQAAYYAAYAQYQQQAAAQREAWTAFVNGYFDEATVVVYSLRS
ncbi:MAG: hypothetical protein E7211_20315 [Clostridium lundense]|nr:hypothetical protein [Clostridium lundense]